MAMPVVVPTYTVDDLERFPDDGNRYELLDGLLLVSPLAGMPHQVVTWRLVTAISEALRPWPEILVASPGGVVLRPKTRLEPDILVFRAPVGAMVWENVPEHLLVVETASPSTVIYDREFKRPAYLTLGVKEVWRVDIDERAIFVSKPDAPPDVAHLDQLTWAPTGLGAPFHLDVRQLFQGIP